MVSSRTKREDRAELKVFMVLRSMRGSNNVEEPVVRLTLYIRLNERHSLRLGLQRIHEQSSAHRTSSHSEQAARSTTAYKMQRALHWYWSQCNLTAEHPT